METQKLHRISELIGTEAEIYSVSVQKSEFAFYDKFISENRSIHPAEIDDIMFRLYIMANELGAKKHLFDFVDSDIRKRTLIDSISNIIGLSCFCKENQIIIYNGYVLTATDLQKGKQKIISELRRIKFHDRIQYSK